MTSMYAAAGIQSQGRFDPRASPTTKAMTDPRRSPSPQSRTVFQSPRARSCASQRFS